MWIFLLHIFLCDLPFPLSYSVWKPSGLAEVIYRLLDCAPWPSMLHTRHNWWTLEIVSEEHERNRPSAPLKAWGGVCISTKHSHSKRKGEVSLLTWADCSKDQMEWIKVSLWDLHSCKNNGWMVVISLKSLKVINATETMFESGLDDELSKNIAVP